MTRGRARRYLLTKQGYYPGVVASMGYDVWDWSTLNAGTLFQDSAKTTPAVANADPVGCWTDGVGGVDATQATTANKPGLATASLNGLPTLAFDGGDLLSTGNISISTFAVWVVFKSTSAALNAWVYSQGAGTFMATSTTTLSITRTLLSRKNLTGNWANDNTWRIARHGNNGTQATHTLAINGVNQTLSDVTVDDVGTGALLAALNIGGLINLTGNIGQVLIMSPYPTDASILVNMESYINSKWSVY